MHYNPLLVPKLKRIESVKTGADKGKIYLNSIPFKGKYIIYRPLLHVAFVGNKAMAKASEYYANARSEAGREEDKEVFSFLKNIGFLEPDPPPPVSLESSYEPKSAVLLLTNRCNLRCTYCYAAAGDREPEDMSWELASQMIDIVSNNAEKAGWPHFDLIFHGGGEPTQHWKVFKKAVEYARRKKIKANISISSNGVWNENQLDFILNNLNSVSLSFDGIREVQEAQRPAVSGGSSFDRVMRSIRAMEKNDFPFTIRITTSNPWLEKLPECVKFICEETACSYIQVEPAFNPQRKGWQDPLPGDADRFIKAYIDAMEIAQGKEKSLMYSGARPWMTVCSFCSAAESALIVRPDGKLVACYEVTDTRHRLEEYFKIGSMESEGPVVDHKALERLMRMRQERQELCRDCFCFWHCAGDCSSRCFSPDGMGHLRFEQRCRINREISKEILARYIEGSGGVWRADVKVLDQNSSPIKPKKHKKRKP
jgi:uncharacterized protein